MNKQSGGWGQNVSNQALESILAKFYAQVLGRKILVGFVNGINYVNYYPAVQKFSQKVGDNHK